MKSPSLYSMLLVLFFLSLRAFCNDAAGEYGVGFNLALDYGTASIWYANGTAVDVVKLEGGVAYKQIIRSASAEPYLSAAPAESSRGSLGFMSLQNYLPSWAATETVSHDVEVIRWMLKGLKGATEAYVEEPLTAVRISSSFYVPYHGWLRNTLSESVESLGLRYLGTGRVSADIIQIYGLEDQCRYDGFTTPDQREPDDPPQMYLAIDSSMAGLSVALVEEECGIAESLREFHNTTLGSGIDFSGKREDLIRQLKHLIRPIDRWYPDIGDYKQSVEISALVLLGDYTEDVLLHEGLLEVFGSSYNNLKNESDKRARLHDPSFAGSRAAAMTCQGRLEYELTWEWDEQFHWWAPKKNQSANLKWWWPFERSS
ncbi:hypothetical protein QM012_001432 [Aureobasidium pullulans]|uniref:Actin-like ATPase domain-containing protein n=1 Tax=Aureobasidium pullulans TaxID=5580 RepID=A0ABR0TEB0_AURPU